VTSQSERSNHGQLRGIEMFRKDKMAAMISSQAVTGSEDSSAVLLS